MGSKKLKSNIKIKLGERSYCVFIQNGLLKDCGSFIHKVTSANKVAILSNPKIFKLYGEFLGKTLKNAGFQTRPIFIPEGEHHKNELSLFKVLKKLTQFGFQRDSCLISLGGGVIGDLGGFASSIYMRGIDFIQCPTTFLAQVDASIGGKTAVDFSGIKNLIGTFYQPKAVFVDPTLLSTLSQRQFNTGLAEVIKYGVIQDQRMFEILEDNLDVILRKEPKILFQLISRSCGIKARIVSADERESGCRAQLNYGHTLGHALESYYNYKVLTHGEAISYGMWFASLLSHQLGLCSKDTVMKQYCLLKMAGLLRKLPRYDPGKVYQKMLLDKKARNGQIQFVLTRKIGLVTIQKNIPHSTILSALTRLQAEASELP
jgi:3-dehydroquinate synthase